MPQSACRHSFGLRYSGRTLCGEGKGQFDAIGGKIYNEVIEMTSAELNANETYKNRIDGAYAAYAFQVFGYDYSNGAYFWNDSEPKVGFNWNTYRKGVFVITAQYGGTTFFRYKDSNKKFP